MAIIEHATREYFDEVGDLQVAPFDRFGIPHKIINNIFGGRKKYLMATKQI